MRMLVMLLMLARGFLCDDRERILTMLNQNPEFHDQWMHLIETQDRQWHEHSADFPLKGLTESLLECASPIGSAIDHADSVRPSDIEIYAEMGHLSRFCGHNITLLTAGELDPCQHVSLEIDLPSVGRFLRIFNPNLTQVTANKEESLFMQRKQIVRDIWQIDGWEEKWKLILIIPSLLDGEASESRQTAVEVLETIEELNNTLPQRTLIAVVRNSGASLWRDASHTHQACRELLQRFQLYALYNSESVWDQVETISESNFRRQFFSVQMLPLLKEAALVNLPENTMDLSVLGYDCSHFSARGLSLLHIAIWNSLLTNTRERSRSFRPAFTRPQCADPQCPFIRTTNNSLLCMWTPPQDEKDSRVREQWIVLGSLLTAVVLCALLIAVLCWGRGRDRAVKVEPLNPVGYNWSCVTKYIDEDTFSTITP